MNEVTTRSSLDSVRVYLEDMEAERTAVASSTPGTLVAFSIFLERLLRRAKLKTSTIRILTSEPYLSEFRRAFTHTSYDPENNYDYDEFFGDVTVNEYVGYKIYDDFPDIRNAAWLTRMKHTMVSGNVLSKLAIQQGFHHYLLASQEVRRWETSSDPEQREKFVKIVADMLEAFCGCLVRLIQALGNNRGVGIEVVHRILKSIFGSYKVSTVYEDLFDPISRLKETYEMKRQDIDWPSGEKTNPRDSRPNAYEVIPIPEVKGWLIKVRGWPGGNGDRRVVPSNEVILSEVRVRDTSKIEAKKIAAEQALKVLRQRYNIFKEPPPKR